MIIRIRQLTNNSIQSSSISWWDTSEGQIAKYIAVFEANRLKFWEKFSSIYQMKFCWRTKNCIYKGLDELMLIYFQQQNQDACEWLIIFAWLMVNKSQNLKTHTQTLFYMQCHWWPVGAIIKLLLIVLRNANLNPSWSNLGSLFFIWLFSIKCIFKIRVICEGVGSCDCYSDGDNGVLENCVT